MAEKANRLKGENEATDVKTPKAEKKPQTAVPKREKKRSLLPEFIKPISPPE